MDTTPVAHRTRTTHALSLLMAELLCGLTKMSDRVLGQGLLAYGLVGGDAAAYLCLRDSASEELEIRREVVRGVAELEGFIGRN